jgi:Putative prokaryotic signal transducing protein
MNLLLRTNDLVLISAVEAILTGARIDYFVADTHTSVMEGSVGAIPRRVMVVAQSIERARKLMTDAGLGHALAPA